MAVTETLQFVPRDVNVFASFSPIGDIVAVGSELITSFDEYFVAATSVSGTSAFGQFYSSDVPLGPAPTVAGINPQAGEFTVLDPFPGGASIFSHGVVVTDGDSGINFQIRLNGNGSFLVTGTVGTAANSAPDVAGLVGPNGGFVIASQQPVSATDNNIQVHIRTASGAAVTNFIVDGTTANDQAPVVVGLGDGGFAVAWVRLVGTETEAWRAVYNADGSVRLAPALFDTAGTTNDDLAITALPSGGFAIAYADSQWGPGDTVNSSIATFAASGALLQILQMPSNGPVEIAQHITTLDNGLLLFSSTDASGVVFSDSILRAVDPATGEILQSFRIGAFDAVLTQGLAALRDSQFVAGYFFDDSLSSGTSGQQIVRYQFVRNAVGDDADDTIVGDGLVDFQYGAGGNDVLIAGDANDHLYGGADNDCLYGGDGDNDHYGGAGDDSVYGGSAGDRIYGDDGNDRLHGGNGFDDLDGGPGGDSLNGGDGPDALVGGDGNDWLSGGTDVRQDILRGGSGDDTYVIDNTNDFIIENPGEGFDQVRTSVSTTLSDNVENLILRGDETINGYGNALDNRVSGNPAANRLLGGDGNDFLDGAAGNDAMYGGEGNDTLAGRAGADNMRGDAGDDVYLVDDAGDVVVEFVGRGTDLVRAGIDFLLPNNVENLTLTGAAIEGSGNGLANTILGTTGDNVLDGRAGADLLRGGIGDDTYIVDNVADSVVEGVDQGIDIVFASVGTTLSNNVEHLTLSGAGNVGGTGNGLANVITGNAGNNVLEGLTGNDRLAGGAGNDRLVGDAGNDRLFGGVGNDRLSGGIGNDTIDGDAGADIFSRAAGDGDDWILDFDGDGGDRVDLVGVTLATLAGNVATLSDGHVLTAQSGYVWTAADFI